MNTAPGVFVLVAFGFKIIIQLAPLSTNTIQTHKTTQSSSAFGISSDFKFLTALRAGPPFSWGVTSGGPPGGRSLSKDGTRADSVKDFCRLVGGVYYAGNLI